jgi:F-type H+-transporting ATPase subunit delta
VAAPLTPAQERRLTERLEEATKKKVRMKYVRDATLRAGFMVRLGDTVWDASVRHELEQLRRLLAGGANSTE